MVPNRKPSRRKVAQLVLCVLLAAANVVQAFLWPLPLPGFLEPFCLFEKRERCGFLNLGKTMHTGGGATPCVEICSYITWFDFIFGGQECGACDWDVELDFPAGVANPVPAADQPFFRDAADRWEQVIDAELSNVASAGLLPTLPGCVYPATIDDLYVCAQYEVNDGAGGVLGRAGISNVRDSADLTPGLPVTGRIRIDVADAPRLIADGRFLDVLTHEMGKINSGVYP